MKKITYIIALALSAAALQGCNPDFLTESPESFLTVQEKYETLDDYELALKGVYIALSSTSYPISVDANFGGYRYGALALGECGTDEVFAANDQRSNEISLDSYGISGADPTFIAHYGIMYQVVSRANQIISRLDDGRLLAREWEPILGEALFLRSLGYFNLLRSYGGVPLLTLPLDNDSWREGLVRNSIEEVYGLIMSDLNKADTLLTATPRNNEVGRATRLAVRTLMARACLHAASMKNAAGLDNGGPVELDGLNSYAWVDVADLYRQASHSCDTVINLMPGIETIPYSSGFWPNRNGVESIFEIQFSTSFAVNVGSLVGHAFGMGNGNGKKWLKATGVEYYGTLEDNDTRTQFNRLKQFYNNQGNLTNTNDTNNFSFMKYNTGYSDDGDGGTTSKTPQDFVVMRLAELYLVKAEALAELAALGDAEGSWVQALQYLNRIRARARGANATAVIDIPSNYITNELEVGTMNQTQRNDLYKCLKPVAGIVSMNVNGANAGTISIAPGELDTPIKRFRIFVLNERKWEFTGEGHRWFDLVRLGYLKKICDAMDLRFDADGKTPDNLRRMRNVKSSNIFRPIPQKEADMGARQNFGY
ncbi:hypothetical protein FACS1894159_01630 [Bacteroidia bacterium]|nr:hypothetical protein FACS1894159_01630 [Bacteroidia bacterium]